MSSLHSPDLLSLNGELRRSQKYILLLIASAFACILLSLIFGALSAFYYIPGISAHMIDYGVSLVQLRPLHTTFASSWIFLAAVACAYGYLFAEYGEPTAGERWRFKTHMILWGIAGLGVLVTLPFGITSGREYLGFHPVFSLLIYIGWILFAWNFLARVLPGFFHKPVYIYMWTVGILFFLWTFAEGHAYLLPGLRENPVADLQVQWKSCGTLVAAFNQMVYGALIYMGERKTGDKRIAQSSTAFWLFWVGLLNSFTNYAHHTYHLPQSHTIKWIAFGVSMLEIILVLRLLSEVGHALQQKRAVHQSAISVPERMVGLSKRWNCFLLTLALLISVPPLNALIHGTHVVMAHAMGSELAIDTYILLGTIAYLLSTIFPKREVCEEIINGPVVRDSLKWLNLSLIGLVIVLLLSGLTTGVHRYLGRPMPEWMDSFPLIFVFFGLAVAWFLLRLVGAWVPLLLRPRKFRTWASEEPSATPPTPAQ